MENIIDKIIDIVNKRGIKVVTLSEPNHRSYTSHTFNFELMKCILQRTDINVFSSEKLGVFDAMMINYYMKNRIPLPEGIEKIHDFSGLGTKRWINYLKKCRGDRYHFVGAEFNHYKPHLYNREALREFFSSQFVESLMDPEHGGGEIQVVTENDRLARDSFQCMEDFYKNRESFWKLNVKRILEKYDKLFIVGFHLDKGEPIGKMIKKMYPSKSLFLGSCSLYIETQILIVDDKYSSPDKFNRALETRNYEEKVEPIDKWAPPTTFEEKMEKKSIGNNGWSMTKINSNTTGKIRGIGCFLAMNRHEYKKDKKMSGIFTPVKRFDYIIYMRESVYEENMFL